MAYLGVPFQESILCTDMWTSVAEGIFVDALASEAEKTGTTLTKNSSDAIIEAMIQMNTVMNVFSWGLFVERFKMLHFRHSEFLTIIGSDGVYYDVSENFVHADRQTWEHLFEKNPLSKAYVYQGEKKWAQLCTIFGWRLPAVEENRIELINISSSEADTPPRARRAFCRPSVDVEQYKFELTKIIVGDGSPPPRPVCRAMFQSPPPTSKVRYNANFEMAYAQMASEEEEDSFFSTARSKPSNNLGSPIRLPKLSEFRPMEKFWHALNEVPSSRALGECSTRHPHGVTSTSNDNFAKKNAYRYGPFGTR